MFKDFINWIQYKIYLNTKQKFPKFKEGEVWWASVGVNVGVEADGKNDKFNRPVLIFKKFNQKHLYALPLTSKNKQNDKFYFEVNLKDKKSYVCLTQLRVLDAKRLQDYYYKLNTTTFQQLKRRFIELIE